MTWLSPAFPVGGFSYSHGLERAVQDGLVADRDSLADWLGALVEIGSGWNDAVLFAEAWRRASGGAEFGDLAELAEALAGSLERHRETALQGAAFLAAAAGWPHPALERLPETCPYCVAVGAVAGAHGVPLADALAAYLQAFTSNLVQASIRLGVTGQSGAVETIAAFEPLVLAVAARAAAIHPRRSRLGNYTLRHHGDATRDAIFEAFPLMMMLALIMAGVLLLLAALHVYWGFGGVWPGVDAADLAARVAGFADTAAAPSALACFVVAALLAYSAHRLRWCWAASSPARSPSSCSGLRR